MRTPTLIQLAIFLALATTSSVSSATLEVARGSDLQSIIDYASDGDTLHLGAKTFSASRQPFTDPLCGNCQDPRDSAMASIGFMVKDKALTIVGADRDSTRLVTGAGYGFYFENSHGSRLENLTITGGKRDADGNATDAAIVVRHSRVTIERCSIVGNDNRDATVVVGIGGVFGREGADVVVRDCLIADNSWDGVALYRGATALVTDCIIRDGRGAGIGVTWDATCLAYRNEVTGYWKGIGSFGTSVLVARNNFVHDNLGWGMIATGQSTADFINNLILHNGNCGIAPWSPEARGRIINNIITENGWRDQWVCPCVGVWNYGDWAKWTFTHNIVFKNKEGEYQGIWDQTGLNGNLNINPELSRNNGYLVRQSSPARHAGDSLIFNLDGSRSHIGLEGGPQAGVRFKATDNQ